jgi:putative transferase (TIGR04331 family)
MWMIEGQSYKMLLVTTADQRTWDKNQRILFLGEWCKRYSEKAVWENVQHEVLHYHWDDRVRLFHDCNKIQVIYEKYLGKIAGQLNELHDVDHSLLYWRILVGPWLQCFVGMAYDRYCSIENAIKVKGITGTRILDFSKESMIPMHMIDFTRFFVSDEWNHFIYGQLIEEFDNILFNIEKIKSDPWVDKINGLEQDNNKKINLKENIIPKIISVVNQIVPDCLKKHIFFKSYLGIKNEILLQMILFQLPVYYAFSLDRFPRKNVDFESRKDFQIRGCTNHFEQCLSKLISLQIPTIYIEGYEALKKQTFKLFPDNPKMIFTSNAFISNDIFKCWSAEKVESRGTKLIAGQHGGHYGSGLWGATEKHENAVSDAYFSFGWMHDEQKKVVPLPAIKFRKSIKFKSNQSGSVLMASASIPRYSYWMRSFPVASQLLKYIHDQQQFVKNLEKQVRDLFLLRLHPANYGWDEKLRWEKLNLGIDIYQGNISMIQQLKSSRLFIGTYNATTFLETFFANFPTIIFWDPKYWELRFSAQPLYNRLKQVGIFHDTPESAAKLVNDIYEDPLSWWSQSHIQEAKNQFCETFAKPASGLGWLRDWRTAIKSVLKG